MTGLSSIDSGLSLLAPTDLATVIAGAELQQRYDSKFILTEDVATALVAALGADWQVLEVDGRRRTDYVSAYYDDEHFTLFRDHVQGRRLRYKVRARRYGDETTEMLELKLKSGRGATEKHRTERLDPLPPLTVVERRWLSDTILEAYGTRPLSSLDRVLSVRYARRTLFNPVTLERVTIDTGLEAEVPDGTHVEPIGGAVVVEVKSARWLGDAARALRGHGLRPLSFSKYCASVAALHAGRDQRMRGTALREFERHASGRGIDRTR